MRANLGRGRDDQKTWLPVVLLTLLVAAFTILELSLLDRWPLATDEATSYFIAHLGWADFWESLATSEANGGAFYLLLRFWLNLGRSETALRVLPLLFAVATIPVLFDLTRRMFGAVTALIAAALLSTNALFLEHGQDLRSYSLSVFMITLSSWFFVRGETEASVGNRIGHVTASTLAVYAHFFAALVLLAQLLAALLHPNRRRSLRFIAVDLAIVGVLVTPLAVFVLAGDRGQVDWIPPLSTSHVHDMLLQLSGMPGSAGIVVLVAVIAVGLIAATRNRPPPPAPNRGRETEEDSADRQWRLGFAALWFVVPLVAALLVSLFKPLFIARYLLVAVPGLALLTAVAVTSLPRRFLIAGAAAVVVALAAMGAQEWLAKTPDEDWARAADYVRTRSRPNDAIAFYAPEVIRSFGYYAGYYTDRAPIAPDVIYPDEYWIGFSRTRYTPPFDRIASDADGYERVWIVAGAKRDEPRATEWEELVARLKQTCSDLAQPFDEIRLFSGCNS